MDKARPGRYVAIYIDKITDDAARTSFCNGAGLGALVTPYVPNLSTSTSMIVLNLHELQVNRSFEP